MPIRLVQVENIGLEFEVPSFTENWLKGGYLPGLWKGEHDGSVQTYRPGVIWNQRYLPLNVNKEQLFSFPNIQFGGEVTSPILDTQSDAWMTEVRQLLDVFNELADYPDQRCAFHVHVNLTGAPVYVLQNLVVLWLQFEALMFRLSVGELGYHRGTKKHMLFCRPLTSPPVVISGKDFSPIFSVDGLLKARNIYEFFAALGNTKTGVDPSKYFAGRYVALNFHNFIKFGTVEFRIFNMSYNPENIITWVHLCQAMVFEAFSKGYNLPYMPLGSRSPNFDLNTVVNTFSRLTTRDVINIKRMYDSSDWVPFDESLYLFTHLDREGSRYVDWSNVPKYLVPNMLNPESNVVVYANRDSNAMAVVHRPSDLENVKFIDPDAPLMRRLHPDPEPVAEDEEDEDEDHEDDNDEDERIYHIDYGMPPENEEINWEN